MPVALATPCIEYAGCRDKDGYGSQCRPGTRSATLAHVVAWEAVYGPKPKDRELHHVCENKPCVNVEHLELLTRHEHCQRHVPTHCVNGHEFTPENTYPRTDRPGQRIRQCRRCNAAAQRRRRARLREAA